MILISDGIENCQADPCALSAQLAGQGIAFTTHVIGFDVASDEHEQLACIAENTGGVFLPAQNAAELNEALAQVQNVIDLQPITPSAPRPAPEPEPEPIVEPELAAISVTAPEQAATGASFPVSWSETVSTSDYIGIVPLGADEGEFGDYIVVREAGEGRLTAPSEPGFYEVRYILREGSRTMRARGFPSHPQPRQARASP